MKDVKVIAAVSAALILLQIGVLPGLAAVDPEELEKARQEIHEEFQWLRAEADVTFVVTASRVKEDIRKSTASISVVTAEQIRDMGARHLMDVLRAVPGMSAWYHGDGHYKIDSRGVAKVAGQDILIMINSHPMNSNFTGGATWTYDTLPVQNIKRVEVIRGPGSALYGANAFSGVINVITKKPEDIDGFDLYMGAGTHDAVEYNLLYGGFLGDLGIAFNFNYFDTDGPKRYVGQDQQNLLDQQARLSAEEIMAMQEQISAGVGAGAIDPAVAAQLSQYINPDVVNRMATIDSSSAPTYIRTSEERLDLSLFLEFKRFTFEGRYIDRERYPGLNALWSESEETNGKPEAYHMKLGYQREITDQLALNAKIYRNYNQDDNYFQGLEGAAVAMPAPPELSFITPVVPVFLSPDQGFIFETEFKNERTGFELQGTYDFGDTNTLVAGITYEEIEQYDVKYRSNALYTSIPGVIMPLPEVQDLTETQNFNKDAEREFMAFFLQDIWDITDDLRLTVGARYDDYSDFGDSFNPRAGLTWQFIDGYDLKLLYGRAFRAPSFHELYTRNNPSILGNPDLEPETVDTYEISLGARFTDAFSGRITAFQNMIKDNIDLVLDDSSGNGTFQNKNDQRAQGIETEFKYRFWEEGYIGLNYTYQDSEIEETGERPINIPTHKGTLMLNLPMGDSLNLYVDSPFMDGFERASDDPRDDISGFAIVNATLIARDFFPGREDVEFRASVYNLFDKEYKYPYSAGSLPQDLLMEGINGYAEFRFTF